MADNIIGNGDGDDGGNDTYRIPGRGSNIPRNKIVKEVEAGLHPHFHVVKIDGEKWVRSNPDATKKDNVDRDR